MFTIPALLYGAQMEDEARDVYTQQIKQKHKNVKVKQNGLFVKPDKAYIAAGTDPLVDCIVVGKDFLR